VWPAFRGIALPGTLVDAMRQWPLPPKYAEIFSGRDYGEIANRPSKEFHDTNYETQQSPLYYMAAGLFLRLLPGASPITELYALRLLNAGLAFGIGLLLLRVARNLNLGWIPVSLLALIPGFGIAMCRVCNDALCALLISFGVVGAFATSASDRKRSLGSLAAGLAPWAKLYGLVALPGKALQEWAQRGSSIRRRSINISLIVLPSVVLAIASLNITGQAIPIMYNIRGAPYARILDIPWLRSAWTVAKTHVWVSGMSFLVFPTLVYVIPIGLLAWGIFLTAASLRTSKLSSAQVVSLVTPVLLFAAALGYQEWRGFSYYGGAGGSGGWYLWAVAVPEMILVAYGASQRRMIWSWAIPALLLFLILTILGDLSLFLDSTGLLARTASGHIRGVLPASSAHIISAYLGSRPLCIGVGAVALAAASWCLGVILLIRGSAGSPGAPSLSQK
jgi:hypothetical protein